MRDLLRTVVDTSCLLDAEAVHAYAVRGKVPAVVVAPRRVEEAAAVLKLATEQGLAVECAGAGSRLAGGNTPRKIDIVMTSARMHAIAEYEPADLVIAVETGASHAQIADAVTPHNQFLALDPSVLVQSTFGATIATGAAGPLRYAHGTPRDQVLGLEIVTGDGRVLRFGGRVVKNVAGYDIVRLMVGSRGTLGFITRVHVRLKPQPEVDRTVAVRAASFGEVADVMEAALTAGLEPAALEILSAPLAERVAGLPQWTLLARLQGNAEAVEEATRQLDNLTHGAVDARTIDNKCWPALAAAEAGAPVCLRFANLPSLLRDTATIALHVAEAANLHKPAVAMHAGDGIVRVLAAGAPADCAAMLQAERAALEQHGGSLHVERSGTAADMAAFGNPGSLDLMKQIKQVFDPAGVLGPGRFVV